ncbi:MAG TPA: zinc-ribbon domain-containing protein, partial [Candidatus Syntrophosphaera sp.]|nr:zinc-ribbon domain-containing protein [Candidatus Syntrophosphaera sp.]
MHYCTNCGKELPSEGKFCPQCGHRVEVQAAPEPVPPQPESPEVIRNLDSEGPSDPTYHLMDPGDSFNGFRIIRMLNKDPEGIKYIAEKDGRQYVLKLFFKYKFSNLDTLINLQARLRRLNQLDNVHTARVVEVNQTHDPAYMAAEYIQGCSLARIKTEQPDRLTEGFVRHIALQLVQTAMAVRQQGLTLFNLTLSGIMVDAADSITVLSSGITYGEVDQREEIFNIGVL